jgi:biotin operon repressor
MPDADLQNRWFSLTRKWGERRSDIGLGDVYDVAFDLIELAGPSRFDRLGSWFDSIEQQWGGEDKYTQLLKLRDVVTSLDFPKRRPQRGDSPAIAEAILALMRPNPKRPWSRPELAGKLDKSVKAIWHLTTEMCDRGLLDVVDQGLGLLALREAGITVKKSVSGRIIEWLIANHEGRFSVVARAIGIEPTAMSTPVQSLRGLSILEPADPHPDPNERAPLRLTADARAMIGQRETIYDRRGFVLWAPT